MQVPSQEKTTWIISHIYTN